ncbi:Deoxyribonuclease-1 [Dissostichus eleginoides]|uniref:Deoxyribonuclease n=1 Tax=Dissostichus eleginoides TaxID=100907 RepID=A0AAD9EUB1_DISEL|nr:Deoxyribonuclease-1 [Dissostichus eleginoides]
MRLLRALGLFLALLHVTSCLLIGAFNIQKFGDKKSSNKDVMDIINQVVHEYDIILIQEVLDKEGTVTQRLMSLVNSGTTQFSYISSVPLGPTVYKERYLYLYNFLYNNVMKNFNREPFVVKFHSPYTAVKDFVLIPQHTCPNAAVKEIDALYDVAIYALSRWSTKNIMLLGDFNAGSKYVPKKRWQEIRLFTDKNFHWLITDNVDTTVSGSKQAYDRIVVTTDMNRGVLAGSAVVFNFKNKYGLTQDKTKDVSDHFPVQVQLS